MALHFTEQEFLSRGRWQIVITEIPYGIQKSKLNCCMCLALRTGVW